MGGYSLYSASSGSVSVHAGGRGTKKGVFLSVPVIIVAAVAISLGFVAVGLIVHFTEPKCQKCGGEATASSAAITTTAVPPPLDVRLPADVKPIHYSLTLAPFMYGNDSSSFYFTGSVNISIGVINGTSNFKLHTNRLQISNPRVYDSSGSNHEVTSVEDDRHRQWHSVTMSQGLQAGSNYTIVIDRFSGPLRTDLRGLYLSSYTENGDTKYLATSQMQPTDARKTFPCFDEPAFKATFDVSLVRNFGFKALSNMPSMAVANVSASDWFNSTSQPEIVVKEDFKTTPVMSTYLLAFIVSEFTNTSGVDSKGRQYNNWVRSEFANLTDFAMTAVINITEYFESYFNVAYPLEKTDQAAVPDFDAGAMENWGLIIYRESLLVFDPAKDRTASKQQIADVISHELAHMWFGNLVTPLWWDDLWLNEGFASFVETLGVNNMQPEWETDAQFVSSGQSTAFDVDSKGASHPIYVEVNHPDEINEIFDSITYSKGSTVLRMLYNSLGDEVFRIGVSNYLKNNSYSNAFHTTLYEHLTQQATISGMNVDVGELMDRWIKQMGYPAVNCTLQDGQLLLSQQHFLSDPTQTPDPRYPSPFDFKWFIPITMATRENVSSWNGSEVSHLVHWMREKSQTFSINATSSWYLMNLRSTGFYRVNYDINNWNLLIDQLLTNHSVFTPQDRARLLDDSFALASAGYINYSIPLEMTKYLKNETHFVPWQSALSKLNYLHSMLHRQSPEYGPFSAYMRSLLTPIYQRVGLLPNANLSHLSRLHHELIVSSACLYGVRDCELDARALFDKYVESNFTAEIPPDIRRRVLCEGVATTFVVTWDGLFNKLNSEKHPGVLNDILRGLGCTSEPWILNRYLVYALEASKIRRQDATTVFSSVSGNPSGLQIVWDYLRGNWNAIQAQMSGTFTVSYFVRNLAAFNSAQKLQEMRQFRTDNRGNLGSASRALDLALESVEINILWMQKYLSDVSIWLSANP